MSLGRLRNILGNFINPATDEAITSVESALVDGSQKSQMLALNGLPLSSYVDEHGENVLNVHNSHVHDRIFNHYSVYFTGDNFVTTNFAGKNTRILNLDSVTNVVAGESFLDIYSGNEHVHQFRLVVSINTLAVTLDAPVDIDVPTGSTVRLSEFNMNKVGTPEVPFLFTIPPEEGEALHITKLLIAMVHSGVPDDGKFGGISALTNGVVIRINKGNGAEYETLSNWKRNQDLREDMFQVAYTTAAPSGENGTSGEFTLLDAGVIIHLDGSAGDKIEVLIQDDLSGLSDFQIKFQGHYE